jgi:protein tyrosine phosphatase
MVWQERPKYIIMLCSFVENGKMKCVPYWPDTHGESKQYGTLKLINYGEDEKDSETVRLL